jgi:predicted DNA-binding protein with PD1-like motif
MKASELIQQLQKLIKEHGDLDVLTSAGRVDGLAEAEVVLYTPEALQEYKATLEEMGEDAPRLRKEGYIEIW